MPDPSHALEGGGEMSDDKIQELKVWRLDYFTLNLICSYCEMPATHAKVISMNDGGIALGTLCEAHCRGEMEWAQDKQGMTMAGESNLFAGVTNDSTLIDFEVLREMNGDLSDALKGAGITLLEEDE